MKTLLFSLALICFVPQVFAADCVCTSKAACATLILQQAKTLESVITAWRKDTPDHDGTYHSQLSTLIPQIQAARKCSLALVTGPDEDFKIDRMLTAAIGPKSAEYSHEQILAIVRSLYRLHAKLIQ